MILTSKNNPLVKETAALKEKKARKEQGMFLVEGRKMAVECQRSDFEIDRVFVAESYVGDNPFAEEKTVRVSDDVFRFLSDEKTPQGTWMPMRPSPLPPSETIPCHQICLRAQCTSPPPKRMKSA